MTLAELRDDILARHVVTERRWCDECRRAWPCDAVRLASLLTTERVAAGLSRATPECNCGFIGSYDGGHMIDCASRKLPTAAALLDAIREEQP